MTSSNVVLEIEHLKLVLKHFMRHGEFFLDVETVGEHRGTPAVNTVTWLSMATHGMTAVIPFGHPLGTKRIGTEKEPRPDKNGKIRYFNVPVYEPPPPQMDIGEAVAILRPLFFSDREKAAYEATFDIASLAKYFGEVFPGPYDDPKVIMRLLDENTAQHDNGLKAWTRRIYGVDYDKDDTGKAVEKHPFDLVAHYSYMDSLYGWLLWRRVLPQIALEKLTNVHEVEKDLIGPLVDVRLAGAHIDLPRLEKTRDELAARLVPEEAACYKAAGKIFNLNSPPQKQAILFGPKSEGGQGLKPWKQTATGWSTDADVLASFPDNALCRSIMQYTDTHKLLSTYIISWLGEDGNLKKHRKIIGEMLYFELHQHGTVTGRFCVDPETLVEMPRDLTKYPNGVPLRQVKPGDWVYTFTWDKRLTLKQVKWVGPTKLAAQTVVVTIRDQYGKITKLTCTPDHLVRKYTGEWVPAGSLKPDARLMGMLQRRYTEDGYAYFPPSKKRALPGKETGGKVLEHRLVHSLVHDQQLSTKFQVHHDDTNKLNNHWGNLKYLWDEDHRAEHSARKAARYQAMLDGEIPVDVHPKSFQRAVKRYGLHPTNHTVLSVESGPQGMVMWDLEVDDTHTFIGADVALHNSGRAPNIQNIPRPDTDDGKLIRGVFDAPEGYSLVVSDYGQIELVMLASMIGSGKLYDGFLAGIDPHTAAAAAILHRKPIVDQPGGITKNERQQLGKTLNFCVPMESEALTKEGWKKYDEITSKDFVLGYKDGSLDWTPVLSKHYFEDSEVVRMSTGGWKARCTPNHRWFGERRTGRGATRRYVPEVWSADSITSECRIRLSAPVTAVGDNSISENDAAILGWVFTDGNVQRSELTGKTSQGADGRNRALEVSIFQSDSANSTQVSVIDKLLSDVPHSRYVREGHEEAWRNQIVQWRIDPQYARGLWERAGLDIRSLEDVVRHMSPQAREAFLEACWRADGWSDPNGVWCLAQNEGPVLEAMQLAAYMCGYDVRRNLQSRKGSPRKFPDGSIRVSNFDHYQLRLRRRPVVTGQKLVVSDDGVEDVWCIQTATKNWVMRQGTNIMITGNTLVNGAGAETVAKIGGFSLTRARKALKDYGREMPEIDEFRQAQIKLACSRKGVPYARSPILGRKRRLPGLYSRDHGMRGYSERQLFNFLIQGGAADLMKLALILVDQMLWEAELDAWLVLTIHDEVVVCARDDQADEAAQVTIEAMTGPEMQKLLRVPLQVDCKVVKSWAEAK